MNHQPYKKPPVERFREVVRARGGNLTRVAETFKVTRTTIWKWMNDDPEFKEVVQDERSSMFDDCLGTAKVVALGIPAYVEEEYVDENGEVRKRRRMDGWLERPDGNMLRYLLGMLARKEVGFGESPEEGGLVPVNGVAITAWIKRENEG